MTLAQITEKTNEIQGLIGDKQLAVLYPFVKDLPSNSLLVEIGTYYGKSTRFYSLANSNMKILTIDLVSWKGEFDRDWHGSENIYIDRKVLREGNIFQVRGDSAEIAKGFNWKIDFLFIDGGHKYEVIKRDINSWTPYVKVGSIIAFHDYYPEFKSGAGKEVANAIDNWIKEKSEYFEKVLDNEHIYIARRIS